MFVVSFLISSKLSGLKEVSNGHEDFYPIYAYVFS